MINLKLKKQCFLFMHITGQGYLTEGGEGAVNINQVGFLNPGTGGFM